MQRSNQQSMVQKHSHITWTRGHMELGGNEKENKLARTGDAVSQTFQHLQMRF